MVFHSRFDSELWRGFVFMVSETFSMMRPA